MKRRSKGHSGKVAFVDCAYRIPNLTTDCNQLVKVNPNQFYSLVSHRNSDDGI